MAVVSNSLRNCYILCIGLLDVVSSRVCYPVHMSNFSGFRPTVLGSSFCIIINSLMSVNQFLYHQEVDYDAETRSN